jgi:hypothetical protein
LTSDKPKAEEVPKKNMNVMEEAKELAIEEKILVCRWAIW